jgi:D-alanyl-D-alanine carboxypeptidase
MTQTKTEDEMIKIITKGGSDFEPNKDAAYSNSNFVVLGYILEKICNEPLKQLVTERIISKIGLTNTTYGGKTDVKNNECYSYTYDSAWQKQPETDMSIPGGAGSVIATSTDLAKFIEALFAYKLVSKASLEQMKTITDNYGMGMFKFPFGTKEAYGHTGAIDGFHSMIAYFIDDSLAVSYCSNGVVYPMNDVLIGVLSIYYNKPYKIPSFNVIALKSGDLDKYLGKYTSTQIPMTIIVTKDKATLIAQAIGQPAFKMEATDTDIFKFEKAGIELDFNPEKKQFFLKQNGGRFLFTLAKTR